MNRATEAVSKYSELQNMSVSQLLTNINNEDKTVPQVIEKIIPQIETLILQIIPKMNVGGRLFYIGAGTSGRLGVVDASEIPPTFGLSHGRVVGIIAGGDGAIRKAVENAEDDWSQAWEDLKLHQITDQDVLIGIAASGSTPYVIGGLREANDHGVLTGCITCNHGSQLAEVAQFPIEAVVGPEFITGSTRMKAGTAQKMILNMISTAVMIQLGHVKGNKMVDMKLSNDKLVERAILMVISEAGVDRATAEALITEHGNVRDAISQYQKPNA